VRALTVALILTAIASAAFAQLPPPVALTKTDATIAIDGDLSDPGWQTAAKYETWYETNPGDNVEPSLGMAVAASAASSDCGAKK